MTGTWLVGFELRKTSVVLCFLASNYSVPNLRPILIFLNAKYMRRTLLFGLQHLKILVKPSSGTFTFKNKSGTLFGACLPLNTLFLPFS